MAGLLARIGEYFSNPVVNSRYYNQQTELRYITDVSTSERWNAYFGINASGVNVTEESALNLSAVYACVRVLAESLASLPHNVLDERNGQVKVAKTHPNQILIHDQPNPWMTSFVFKETLMTHVLLWGDAYAEIIRGGNSRPVELKIIKPWEVSVIEYKGKLYYQISGRKKLVGAEDMLHIPGLSFNGINGKSPIRLQAETLGIDLAAQRFGKKFFDNGAHVGGALSTPNKLDDKSRENVRQSWKFRHGGVDNVASTAILEEGLKYERIGMPPEEAQFIETRKYARSTIAGWYKVPAHMIGDLEHATFSNIEHQDLSYVKHSLVPWCIRFEQEYNRKLFRDSEKGRFYTKFNVNALMRGDSAARSTFYEKMHKLGAMNSNEIRALEDMNPYEEGNRYYVQANNMVPVDKIDEFLASKSAKPQGNGTGQGQEGAGEKAEAEPEK